MPSVYIIVPKETEHVWKKKWNSIASKIKYGDKKSVSPVPQEIHSR